MGLIWLRHPVLWRSSRIPSGYQVELMTADELKLIQKKWYMWYSSDIDYGQTTLIFFCVGIGIACLIRFFLFLRARQTARPDVHEPAAGVVDRAIAFSRYLSARQIHLTMFHWYSPPVGVVVTISGIFIFVMALMLGAQPYYWPNHAMGHSMPIATRSGWISLGIMPFMLVFATKVNWIGILTGTSHEKLQVFHRWTAFFMYITSLVHTFPFIVNAIRDGEMEHQWNSTPWYWTGVAALIPQTYLVALSWGIFRNRYYELFKKLHYAAAGLFMASLFIHVNFRLTSWDYFWACLGLYGLSWLIRVGRTHYNSGLLGIPTSVELLTPRTLQVTIQAPKRLRWSAGQHVFVRFVGLGAAAFFSSHPFTISSIAATESDAKRDKEEAHSLELVLRIKKGITAELARAVRDKPSKAIRAFVDGPYGGVPMLATLRNYDLVYLISGGSGTSFTIPIFLYLSKTSSNFIAQRIKFTAAVRTSDEAEWINDTLASARDGKETKSEVDVYITASEGTASDNIDQDEKPHNGHGRPALPALIRSACNSKQGEKIAFIACGPESLLYDVRNTVAACQLSIARGRGAGSKPKDIFLHTENYGW